MIGITSAFRESLRRTVDLHPESTNRRAELRWGDVEWNTVYQVEQERSRGWY
jgi:hypothetical protein